MPHSITHNDACLALFNKKWGIPFADSSLLDLDNDYLLAISFRG